MSDLFNEQLPVISLWQPWATLIDLRAKTSETRSWPAAQRLIGRRIGIHAAKRKPDGFEMEHLRREAAACREGYVLPSDLPYGALICTAVLAGVGRVVAIEGAIVHLHDGAQVAYDDFGNYAPGRWVWRLRDVQSVAPVPMRGQQGWWSVPVAQVAA